MISLDTTLDVWILHASYQLMCHGLYFKIQHWSLLLIPLHNGNSESHSLGAAAAES